MSLERRLRQHFGDAGKGLPAPTGRCEEVTRRGRRRRTVQNSVIGIAGVVAVLGAGFGLRNLNTARVVFDAGPTPSTAAVSETPTAVAGPTTEPTTIPRPSEPAASEARPEEPVDRVAMQDLGAPVLAYGGRTRDLKVYREDGDLAIWSGKVDMAIADNAGGIVLQSGKTISWVPEADARRTTKLVETDSPLALRTMLPDGRVLYSMADTKRSEDMVERFYAVALAQGGEPQLIATDPAFEREAVGPAATADAGLVMASCHLMCSLYAWPDDDTTFPFAEALYHGGGSKGGPLAAIEGLTATPDGRVIGMVESQPAPGSEPPQLVLLDGTSFKPLAAITLPFDEERYVGAADVSLSADGQRVLVSVESHPGSTTRPVRDTFLIEGAITDTPRLRRVDFDGVVRWLHPEEASRQ